MKRLITAILCPLGAAGMLGVVPVSADDISGKDVYKYCKSCHGDRGQGSSDGKYPRIAGLPAKYLERQLHDFKSQTRVNKPMIPIFKHVRFDGKVIETTSNYIAAMSPQDIGVWSYDPPADALSQFDSRAAFDAAGKASYQQACASCHGERAAGQPETGVPPLVNQYPAYLEKQVNDFRAGEREHEHAADCSKLAPAEWHAVLSYLIALKE